MLNAHHVPGRVKTSIIERPEALKALRKQKSIQSLGGEECFFFLIMTPFIKVKLVKNKQKLVEEKHQKCYGSL